MPELNELPEWLGYEVVMDDGEAVVRHRVNARGRWVEREARATACEVRLYDAVRGLVGSTTSAAHLMPLARVAQILGLGEVFTINAVMEKLAGLLADNRHWREKANGTDEELVRCRAEIVELKAGARLGPKGGDRNEFVRQIRAVAARVQGSRGTTFGMDYVQGAVAMANAVLHMLNEAPVEVLGRAVTRVGDGEASDPNYQPVMEAVQQIKADRFTHHPNDRSAFLRNQGEQNAFNMVISLLEGNSVGMVEL